MIGGMEAWCRLGVVAGCCVWASGCSQPQPRADFDSDDPSERSLALAGAATAPTEADLPHIIALLDSDDPAIRMFAQAALTERTGETLGYHHADPPARRAVAVDRWEAWYRERAAP